jgi:Fuc2NAc and GlcNAc transferase
VRRAILDVPNERSSHKTPTPRGGGLVIATVCLGFYLLNAIFLGGVFVPGYFVGAALIALISWFDDLKSVPPAARFLVHAVAAGLAVFSLGGWPALSVPPAGEIKFGLFGSFIAVLWIVWLTNAYNFMDGIDGIAAMQALTAGVGWLLLGGFFAAETTSLLSGVLAFSSLGFLLHNWQPARIFMGDVGSAFLGYTFAVMPLLVAFEARQSSVIVQESRLGIVMLAGILLVWLFVFDTVFTFFRRLLRGEKVWRAHRSHLYQKLVINGHSHQFVTLVYGLLSVSIVVSLFLWIRGGREDFGGFVVLHAALIGAGLIIFSRFRKIVDVT